MTTEAGDVSRQIAELAKEFRQEVIAARDFKEDNITTNNADKVEIRKVIALSQEVEKNIYKSQAFWDKLERQKKRPNDADIKKELKRMTNLADFMEKAHVFLEINTYLRKEEGDSAKRR